MPLTKDTPKCLVKINNKSLIDYWLGALYSQNIKNVLINTHYKSEMVSNHLRSWQDKLNLTISYEKNLLGTAGTLINSSQFIGNSSVMVIHADNLSHVDMKGFIAAYAGRRKNCLITMMTFITDSPKDCGIIEIDKDGIVISYDEKSETSKGNLANGAVYIISYKAFKEIASMRPTPFDISQDVIPKFIKRINTFHNNYYHRDIGSLRSLKIAEFEFSKFINSI